MSQTKQPPGRDLYVRDEHEWIAAQISALESGQLNRLDRENLIGFLSEMTVRDRRELRSRLTVRLLYLLKARYQPERVADENGCTLNTQMVRVVQRPFTTRLISRRGLPKLSSRQSRRPVALR